VLDKSGRLCYNQDVKRSKEETKMEDKMTVKELIEKLSQYDEDEVVTLTGLDDDDAILYVGDYKIVMET
jgi:hypothetical protein